MKRKPEETPADETGDAHATPEGAATPPADEPLAAELAEARKLAQQLKHQTLELTADLDNQAKRFARERQVVREEIVTRFAREMIEVLDNLDSVVRSMSDEERASPLGKGVALTQVVFLEKLKSFGVERIEAEGRPFDPAWHEAMRETPRADVAPGTVLAEWTRGYRLGGKLVRAAKVEVARAADEDDAAADGS
ncbi:MAG TPA: nucleotide exchange factor GrpE [Planctomycetota bacterium]|jgi:molecular chaperone GrpE|nr:nucleotide exchange factor GrpE [Planctomycetota bacterium]